MAVPYVITFVGFEVGIETAFVFAHCQIPFPRIHVLVDAGAGCILPFCFCRQTIRLDIYAFASERPTQEVSPPVGERICLLPAYADHGIVRVTSVGEVHAHVWFVVRVLEVVDPRRCVGVDVDYVCVEEVIIAGEGTRDRLTDYFPVLVHVGRVL